MKFVQRDPATTFSFYAQHLNWKVKSFNSNIDTNYEHMSSRNFTMVTLTLHVARTGSYYYRLFVAPAAVCLFVIPVIHFLPPSSNEKLTLGEYVVFANLPVLLLFNCTYFFYSLVFTSFIHLNLLFYSHVVTVLIYLYVLHLFNSIQ